MLLLGGYYSEVIMRDYENNGAEKNRAAPRRRRRKLSKLAYAFILITVVFCAAAVFAAVSFKVATIKVSGNSLYSSQQVAEASGIRLASNLLHVNKSAAGEKICEALPYVESAKVKLSPMTTVEIVVTKASPAYIITYGKSYVYVDSSFKVLEVRSDVNNKTLPQITGAQIVDAKPGNVIVFKDKSQLDEIRQIAEALTTSGLGENNSFDVTDSYQVLVKYDNRITIILGTPIDADKKLEAAAEIIKTKLQTTDKGTLDVSAQDKRYTFNPS
jgi:cell division protein FtsQ